MMFMSDRSYSCHVPPPPRTYDVVARHGIPVVSAEVLRAPQGRREC